MDGLIALTISGTTDNAIYDMTVEIPEGKTLILKQARFEIKYTDPNFPRMVNVAIGNTISSAFVIDNDAGYNYFKIPLQHNPFTVSGNLTNISVTYPDVGYRISGRLDKNCRILILDNNHAPLGANLVYYSMQFIVI